MTRAIGTRGWPVDGREQPDLGEPAAAAEAEDRVGAGLLAADRVDRDVAAAAGEVARPRRARRRRRRARVCSAPSSVRDRERLRVAVHRDHPGAHGRAIITALSPTPPAPTTVTHSPARDAGPADERAVGRGEPAAQARGGREVDRVGQGDEVGVGGVERDVLGERAPVREARLLLVGAHLRVARPAPLAPTAPAHERHGDPVADLPARDAGADLGDRRRRARGPARAGSAMSSWPAHACQSLRHTPVAATRTTTPPAGAVGRGTSRTSGRERTASITTARMAPSLRPAADSAQDRAGPWRTGPICRRWRWDLNPRWV